MGLRKRWQKIEVARLAKSPQREIEVNWIHARHVGAFFQIREVALDCTRGPHDVRRIALGPGIIAHRRELAGLIGALRKAQTTPLPWPEIYPYRQQEQSMRSIVSGILASIGLDRRGGSK